MSNTMADLSFEEILKAWKGGTKTPFNQSHTEGFLKSLFDTKSMLDQRDYLERLTVYAKANYNPIMYYVLDRSIFSKYQYSRQRDQVILKLIKTLQMGNMAKHFLNQMSEGARNRLTNAGEDTGLIRGHLVEIDKALVSIKTNESKPRNNF